MVGGRRFMVIVVSNALIAEMVNKEREGGHSQTGVTMLHSRSLDDCQLVCLSNLDCSCLSIKSFKNYFQILCLSGSS